MVTGRGSTRPTADNFDTGLGRRDEAGVHTGAHQVGPRQAEGPGPVGRPPKWSEATRRRIIDLMRSGLTLKEACQLMGIGYRTAQRYLSKDAEYLKARMEARLAAR